MTRRTLFSLYGALGGPRGWPLQHWVTWRLAASVSMSPHLTRCQYGQTQTRDESPTEASELGHSGRAIP
jgi:hypothetical protein